MSNINPYHSFESESSIPVEGFRFRIVPAIILVAIGAMFLAGGAFAVIAAFVFLYDDLGTPTSSGGGWKIVSMMLGVSFAYLCIGGSLLITGRHIWHKKYKSAAIVFALLSTIVGVVMIGIGML